MILVNKKEVGFGFGSNYAIVPFLLLWLKKKSLGSFNILPVFNYDQTPTNAVISWFRLDLKSARNILHLTFLQF